MFDTPFVSDLIQGFTSNDVLQFKGGSFADLSITTAQQGNTNVTTITGYGSGVITLTGVDKSTFDNGAHMSFG